jgi:hypothetical protein
MLLSELIGRDVELLRCGSRYYRWKLHDSFVIDNVTKKWHWYSRSLWGDSFDWLKMFSALSDRESYLLAQQVNGAAPALAELDQEKIRRAQANMDNALWYLYQKRRLTAVTARKYRLGWVRGAVCLPNYSDSDELVSARYRKLRDWVNQNGRTVRYYSEPGSHPWYPYGLWVIPKAGDVLFLVEGEFKAMTVNQLGFYALGTQGTEFRASWTGYLDNWDRVVYLRDSRELGGLKSANKLKKIYPRAEVVCIPRPHKAVDDYYKSDNLHCREFLERIHHGRRRTESE